jgi:hypothetical protein
VSGVYRLLFGLKRPYTEASSVARGSAHVFICMLPDRSSFHMRIRPNSRKAIERPTASCAERLRFFRTSFRRLMLCPDWTPATNGVNGRRETDRVNNNCMFTSQTKQYVLDW